jgi:hypothetical protein
MSKKNRIGENVKKNGNIKKYEKISEKMKDDRILLRRKQLLS